jgi:hypothetical protein
VPAVEIDLVHWKRSAAIRLLVGRGPSQSTWR